MHRLSHRRQRSRPRRPGAALLLARTTRTLQRARLHYGHGTERARDDAAALVWHALRLPRQPTAARLRRGATARQLERLRALVERRVRDRVPVVYLTRRCWFAGIELHVDERVLIPRSPLAELIVRGFAPWIDAAAVRRVADIGTGSGCIAIACARALPHARVDAVDVSPAALAVARRNIRRYRLGRRVRAIESDYLGALAAGAYDMIVSNPPYVGRGEMARLPAEYRHEPRLALAAGADGLDAVRALLRGAARCLRPGGLLVVEVGNSEGRVRRQFARLPFTWLQFVHGGGGVFMLTREQLVAAESS